MQGNAIAAEAAKAAGATHFYGYPITPSTEIFETWIKLTGDPKRPNKSPITGEPLQYLQCEDEMASGFAMIGSCMAGKKAFTATAGPGNILMQDAFAMAEALRVPTVAIIQQRGGMSTSTVIYSQEEVTLTCFGGNGEGFRIVYSPSGLQDLYDYTVKSFNTAWKYRFPTFILGDGYQGKMEGEILIRPMKRQLYIHPKAILLGENRRKGISTNLRNCYDQEEQINTVIEQYREEYKKISPEIAESESYKTRGSRTIIIAHGIVANAAKEAVNILQSEGKKVGLWRPITLRPLDTPSLMKALGGAETVIFVESAEGQLARLILDNIGHNVFAPNSQYSNVRKQLGRKLKIGTLYRPGLGITPAEIIQTVGKYAGKK